MDTIRSIGIAALSCLFICCSPPDDEKVYQEPDAAAAARVGAHEEGDMLLDVLGRMKEIQSRYVNAMLCAKYEDSARVAEQVQLVLKQLEAQNNGIINIVGRLLTEPAGTLKEERIFSNVSNVYRERIKGALALPSPESTDEALVAVMHDWAAAQNQALETLCARLVPEPQMGLADEVPACPRMDAWMRMPRNERKGRVALVSLIGKFQNELECLRAYVERMWRKPGEDADSFDKKDHRRYLALIQTNIAVDEFIVQLYSEFQPELSDCYARVSSDGNLPLASVSDAEIDEEVEAFVGNIHRSLLLLYSYDETDDNNAAEELRSKVEADLARSMALMKRAYKSQLHFLRESLSFGDAYNRAAAYRDTYDEKLIAIQSVFLDDVRFIRYYSYWTGEDSYVMNDLPKFKLTSPAPVCLMPRYMISCTMEEGMDMHLYQRTTDFQREIIRRTFRSMCDECVSLVIGCSVSAPVAEKELQFEYLKYCFMDAEYAWEQYAASISNLIEPLLYRDWGSGTGIILNSHLNTLYDNHYNYYSSVINFHKKTTE